ncbi:SDR family NAD(P)-dependent oxidoreductase [Janibacter anophelis]|uniref:SDR family NAD(P)-dependent oxidoreductase n=1 Tax=Janibacter anophelis TaxID=319054 RepID=UPI000ADD6008|nr:SDR family NAD(P)-dependent oxidoreductase [Janibacter anophelis]
MKTDAAPLRAALLGCGDLGSRVGTALQTKGVDVTGVRRTVTALPPHIRGVAADLAAGDVPDLPADLLVITMTPDRRDPGGYRTTYVDAVRHGLEAVLRAGTPRRAVLVSSTSVYEGLEGDLDETTDVAPQSDRPRILLESEALFHEALPHGTVLRLSGLYGRPGGRLVQRVRDGENHDPGRWTNRIHREDAATAITHLLTIPAEPAALYVGTDDEPASAGDVRDLVADELGIARPAPTGVQTPTGRRMRNARLRAAGVELRYPTYREGYAAILRG